MKPSLARIVFEFYPQIGGIVTDVMELSSGINEYLSDQVIIAPKFNAEIPKFDDKFGIKIIRIDYIDFKRPLGLPIVPLVELVYMINVYRYLKKFKKIHKFDIIQAHGITITAFATVIGKLLDIPVVGMVHGSCEAYSNISGIYETIMAKIFKPNHAFVINDGSIAPKKFKKLWKERITIIDHGIDVETFKYSKKDLKLLRDLEIDENDFIILSTSGLIPVKNIDCAILSFKNFLNKIKDNKAYLLLVGDGPLKNELVNLAKSLSLYNYIRFIGEVPIDDIPKFISISDVVIGTSTYSNLNRSVQEAMACEKPIVAFDSGNTNKLIVHKSNGLLARSGDIDSFAENLNLLYIDSDLRRYLGGNARKTIKSQKCWGSQIKSVLELYQKILSNED